LEEQTGGFATSQISRANAATSSLADSALHSENIETSSSVSSTFAAAYAASTQNVLLYPNGVEPASWSAIGAQPSTVLRTVLPSVSNTQYSLAGALAILGSLALASSVWHPPLPSRQRPPPLHFLTPC
jgi:hypothetical protein